MSKEFNVNEVLSHENGWVADVADFWREKLPCEHLSSMPSLPSSKTSVYLLGSLAQEMAEISQALATGNLVEYADGITDTIYVLIGMALQANIPLAACFAEVHRSNMDKLPAGPGTMGRRTVDGKSMKPEGWVPPRIKEILDERLREALQAKKTS